MKLWPKKRIYRLAEPVEMNGRRIDRIAVRRATATDRVAIAAELYERGDPLPGLATMALAMCRLCDCPIEALLALSPADQAAVTELVTASVTGDF
jgi:hypothetical protein